ncbi:hypothetical protein M501DRAFT_952232 [Patellaria atrata CBS 101060]|uniref:Mid2 domain-containing protein n=1 Tax=Patellaria atrata CBS 101060 TaxID=1346257 RepID=A0A9P4SCI5_9PEZI|nr:hypothetical protein M501DRAFT_952232 [Patellaria atrata CBS 101060]
MRSSVVVAFTSLVPLAFAQCYWPNGVESDTDAPCGEGDAAVCCPLQWECLSNGLCHYPNADYLGRYTCTDRSWDSDNCPKICLDDNTSTNGTDSGNEAVSLCSNGQYCCNGNRSGNCCDDDADFFDLDEGSVTAYISSLGGPNGAGPTSSGDSQSTIPSATPTSSDSPSSSGSPPSSNGQSTTRPGASSGPNETASAQASETVLTTRSTLVTSVSTNSAGGITTVVRTDIVTATAGASSSGSSSSDSGSSNTGAIAGGVVGGVAAIAILALLLWWFLRRRKRRDGAFARPTSGALPDREYIPPTDGEKRISELSGSPVTPVTASAVKPGSTAKPGSSEGYRGWGNPVSVFSRRLVTISRISTNHV